MSDIVFTKHALQRIDERAFTRHHVEGAIQKPDSVVVGKQSGTLEYQKKYDQQQVTAIVAKGSQGEDVVLSCWIDPPVYGTRDYRKKERYRRYQKAGFWEKIWMDILSAFGL